MSNRTTRRRSFAAMTMVVIAEANARRIQDELQLAIDAGIEASMIAAQLQFFGCVSKVMI